MLYSGVIAANRRRGARAAYIDRDGLAGRIDVHRSKQAVPSRHLPLASLATHGRPAPVGDGFYGDTFPVCRCVEIDALPACQRNRVECLLTGPLRERWQLREIG